MGYFYLIFPCFNIIIGLYMALVGFKIYKPFSSEKAVTMYEKFGWFYKYGGIAVCVIGICTLISDLNKF